MFRAPGQLPPLSLLLDDIPTRCARTIARHLGVNSRTLQRYQVADQAPRAVHLALFWETRWGQSVLDAEIFNRDSVQRGLIGALQAENAQLRATVARLVAELDTAAGDAANAPLFDPLGRGAGCQRAPAPRPIARAASAVELVAVAAAGRAGTGAARVAGDPGAQLGQLREDERGHDGAADEHQALA